MYNDTDKIIKRMKRKQKKKNDMKFRFIYPMIQINNKKKNRTKKKLAQMDECAEQHQLYACSVDDTSFR